MSSKCTAIKNELREMIARLEQEHNIKLSTTQKILLSINGPITPILDVLYGEVRLFMLDQHFENADKDIADLLGIDEGDEILYRNSIVFKHSKPLIYILSYIPKSRCSDRVINKLLEGKTTTGRIINESGHETIRIINDISLMKATPILTELFKTTDDMLTREYSIIHKGKIVIWTKEVYPLSYFKE